jgi:glycosyltransferase involved in cell wall biosynthesis
MPSAPTRVLVVNKYHYPRGGAEHYALDLARLLHDHGVETVQLAMQDARNLPSATERFFPPHVDFEDPHGWERARVAGRMLYSGAARRGTTRLLDEVDVDLAHVHNVYHQLSPSVFGPLRRRRIPVVMTVHDFKLVCPVYNLISNGEICDRCVEGGLRHVVRRRCNRGSLLGSALVGAETWTHRRLALYERGVDVFIAPSPFTRDTLVRGGYPASRIRVVPNFVDTEAWAPVGERGDHVAYAGRLSEEKGPDVLLRALAGTSLRAVLIGDGPQRAALERLAGELGVRATFTGQLAKSRVRELLGSARAVVVPSRCVENCPLAVIEAMALGRPVVASRVGGIPGLVEDDGEGMLVEHDSPEALRAALLALADDPDGAERMGARGRERAVARHSAAAHLEAVLDVYGEATERARGAALAPAAVVA